MVRIGEGRPLEKEEVQWGRGLHDDDDDDDGSEWGVRGLVRCGCVVCGVLADGAALCESRRACGGDWGAEGCWVQGI